MKTEVMFFFDTEDYTSESCADATLAIANILEEEGVKGHFAVVGLFAQQLSAWDRDDVKNALRRHIIGTHTYGHSIHPDIVEMSDGADYETAHKRVLESEALSADLLHEHLGVRRDEILFAVPPGNSVTYVGMYCYHEMGIPFYCDTVVHDRVNTLMDYCSMTQIPYSMSFETLFLKECVGDTPRKNELILDEMRKYKRVILYLHPNMCMKTVFWDGINNNRENKHPFGEWEAAPDRPLGETIAYWHRIRMLIRAIKQDDRFQITTLPEIRTKRDRMAAKPICREDLPRLYRSLQAEFAPVKDGAYCVADIFYAAAAMLRGESCYNPGTVKGFLFPPKGITEEVSLRSSDLTESAKAIKTGDFIPEIIPCGQMEIGPADWLFAALAVLTTGADTVTAGPRPQEVDMSAFYELQSMDLRGTWLHTYEFEDAYVSDRLRLQSWTLRYYEL